MNKKLILFLLIFVLIQLSYLLTYPYLDSDRAVEGVMAKHILEKGVHPFFLYGSHYCGGCAIIPHLAALFFSVFGYSSIVFKIVNILVATGFIVISYFFVKRFFNEKVAMITTFLLVIPPLYLSHVYIDISSYVLALIFNVSVCYLFFLIFFEHKKSVGYFIVLGIVSGIAYWNLEFVLPLIIFCLFYWFLLNKKFFLKRNFFAFAGSFLIGLVPLIYYNLNNNFANVKQFLAGNIIHRLVCDYNILPDMVRFGSRIVDHCRVFEITRISKPFYMLITTEFKNLFGFTNFSWAYYLIFIFSIFYLIYINHSKIFKSKEGFVVGFIIFYIVIIIVSRRTDTVHLIPLFPFTLIPISICLVKMEKKVCYAVLIILLAVSLFENFSVIFDDTKPMQEDYLVDIDNLVSYLNKNNIRFAYAPYKLKWHLIFYMNEETIVSCEGLCPCLFRYPQYEDAVRNSDSFAVVLRKDSNLDKYFKSYLINNSVLFVNDIIGTISVYHSNIRPIDAIKNCVDRDQNYYSGFET